MRDTSSAASGESRGFWQSRFVQNVVPFLSSLSFHAVIIVLAVTAARVIMTQGTPSHVQEELQQQRVSMVNDPSMDGNSLPYMGELRDPTRDFMQNIDPNASDDAGVSERKGLSRELTRAGSGSVFDGETSDEIAVGTTGGGKGSATGFGIGNERWGIGDSKDGKQAAFGPPGGGAGGLLPGNAMFGGGGVKHVAFVCDASGSMISKMAGLKEELAKAVVALRPFQSFNVIFFKEQKFLAMSDASIERATPEAKRTGLRFLDDVVPSGTTNPIPGLELAFRQKPQLIWLLTDGDFPDNAVVLQRVRELNHDHAIQINTIAFVGDADREVDFIDLLKKIASENHGTFKLVRESDLSQ